MIYTQNYIKPVNYSVDMEDTQTLWCEDCKCVTKQSVAQIEGLTCRKCPMCGNLYMDTEQEMAKVLMLSP